MPIICSCCGGIDVSCEAKINPNTKEFIEYVDCSFNEGYCNDCQETVFLVDPEDTMKDLESEYARCSLEYREPKWASCRIVLCESCNEEQDVKIKLSSDIDEADGNKYFYYCNGIEGLKSLCSKGVENFVITGCYGMYSKL